MSGPLSWKWAPASKPGAFRETVGELPGTSKACPGHIAGVVRKFQRTSRNIKEIMFFASSRFSDVLEIS